MVELVALPHGAPAVIRLRRLLKALRCYGLKAVRVVEVPSDDKVEISQLTHFQPTLSVVEVKTEATAEIPQLTRTEEEQQP
jgi:hypothetical protein